jgi:UMF1 family MFS transporter
MSSDGDDEEAYRAQPQLRYAGEDTCATTSRELNGWYAYPIAAEVFAVVAVGKYNMRHVTRYPTHKSDRSILTGNT